MAYKRFHGRFVYSGKQELADLRRSLSILNNHIASIDTSSRRDGKGLDAIVQKGCRTNGKDYVSIVPSARDITELHLKGDYSYGPVLYSGKAVVGIGKNVYTINYQYPKSDGEGI